MLLLSAAGTEFLRLDLLPLARGSHDGWISYRLLLGQVGARRPLRDQLFGAETNDIPELFELTPSSEEPLFLSVSPEDEVSSLAAAVRLSATAIVPPPFTPIDERDFTIQFSRAGSGTVLTVSAPGYDGRWSHGVQVSPESLMQFAAGLELERDAISAALSSGTV